jgi:hypothetical protein
MLIKRKGRSRFLHAALINLYVNLGERGINIYFLCHPSVSKADLVKSLYLKA